MAVAFGAVAQPGLLSQQFPPPLLPKPGKDNVRLQKLLKRTAKKKSSAQTSQSATPFRSSLSPVNEASPDLERSDNSTPPKTPETPLALHRIQPAPRFTVRPLYQHVASPYPQRAAYGRPASMSPTPSHSYMQDVATSSLQVDQQTVPRVSLPAFPHPESPGVPVPEFKKPASSTLSESPAGLTAATHGGGTQPKPKSPGPTPYSAAGGQGAIRPLIVLAPIGKSKSPRPTFKATEPSRSPKPMFDVPQIRMYTARTSYYETSRTPPVYDTEALTAIGGTVSQSKTETLEGGRGTTPPSLIPDSQRKANASDVTTGMESKAETTVPTPEIKRSTPTPEVSGTTPTADTKRATPTSDVKTAAIRVKTPTYEFEMSRITAGRPRTPARAATPVFEVSRPNPLLFAVTPIPVEPERSSSSQTVSAISKDVKSTELPGALRNGDITPAEQPGQEGVGKPKAESDLMGEMIRPAPIGALTPTSAVTTSQRPKTPTYEASRLLSTSPGYKRPKTPTYGIPRSGVSPVAFQRPKTPTQLMQKSSYRGLTPAEYAAYGGIKTFSPAFGIGSTATATQEEMKDVAAEPSQGPAKKYQFAVEVSKDKEPSKDQPEQMEETAAPIPTIVVSQASESSGTTSETTSHPVAAKQETTLSQEKPQTTPPSAESQTSVRQKKETLVEETKAKAPEAPKGEDCDPLKAVKKLLSRDKVQTTDKKPQKESTADVFKQPEPVKDAVATSTVPKDSGTGPVTAGLPIKTKPADGTQEKRKDKEAEAAVPTASSTKQGEKPLLKGLKTKTSGWSRLKKHMVVEQEEPKFPETDPVKEVWAQAKSEANRQEETECDQDNRQASGSPKATKMWDAVLFQMFSSKENIMHQIELNKNQTEQTEETTPEESKQIPSFAYRLPVLLFSPKFDAKKLKEAASRPVTKISSVFEMGLIGRKGKEEEPKDFNRTARGFAAS